MAGGNLLKNDRTVAIVQARMGSSRLPGKMMMKLGGHPILLWVLHRIKKSKLVHSITLATTQNKADEPLVDLAQQLAIAVFRGSESDVLGRFLGAAEEAGAGKIIRICADDPLVAPEEIDRLVKTYSTILKKGTHFEKLYAFNFGPKLDCEYPDGLGGEIFSLKFLQKLNGVATQPLYREHVTGYVWDHPQEFSIHSVKAPRGIAFPGIKMDVDTKEDLEKLKVLCDQLNFESSAREIVEAYKERFGSED